ncbi:MAG: TVP38/TMEM64 family protein [Elusimicrobiota bacterium]
MKRVNWFGAAVALLLLVVLAGHWNVQGLLRRSLTAIQNMGPWAPALFIGAYIATTILFIPGSLLTLGAGVLFGVLWGAVYVSIGSVIGATVAFILGRTLARDWVSRRVKANAKFKAVSRAVAKDGWKIVALVRLSPIFPFNLLNYALGVTEVSFRDYVLASWLGMLPGTLLYVYIGSLAGNLARLGSSSGRSRSLWEWTFYAVGLLATLVVSIYVGRIARRAMREQETLE